MGRDGRRVHNLVIILNTLLHSLGCMIQTLVPTAHQWWTCSPTKSVELQWLEEVRVHLAASHVNVWQASHNWKGT
jgi:hypothetical protein